MSEVSPKLVVIIRLLLIRMWRTGKYCTYKLVLAFVHTNLIFSSTYSSTASKGLIRNVPKKPPVAKKSIASKGSSASFLERNDENHPNGSIAEIGKGNTAEIAKANDCRGTKVNRTPGAIVRK
jgi:hypothetical protein